MSYNYKGDRTDDYSIWFDKNEKRRNELFSKSKSLNCYSENSISSQFKIPSIEGTIRKLESRVSFGSRKAKELSFKIFFISLLVVIIGRYSIKSIKWVDEKTTE